MQVAMKPLPLLGSNVLTIFIALTAYRRANKWAWWAFWYWPLMFASHFILYREGTLRYVQVFLLILSVATLLANYRKFFKGPEAT